MYEDIIQKYEKDIRNHISLENQMRVYIDNLTNQVESETRKNEKLQQEFDDQISEVKREKRRLDDLLTIKEKELENYVGQD